MNDFGLEEDVQEGALASSIDEIFSEDGLLARELSGYEMRPSQIELSKAVYSQMQGEYNLCGEGVCGVGKTISYLVPAIKTGKKTVVATANIALQEQLINKDLPFLEKVFGDCFVYVLLKGRNNYICREKIEKVREDFDSRQMLFTGQYSCDIGQAEKILKWALKTESGDRSELDFEPQSKLWSKCSSTKDDCLGKQCDYRGECFVEKAREDVKEADIIVTNYHILFSYVKVLREQGFSILPEFDYLICDEGHKISDIARSFFGWEFSKIQFFTLINVLRKVEDLARQSAILFESLDEDVQEKKIMSTGMAVSVSDVHEFSDPEKWFGKFDRAFEDFWYSVNCFHDSREHYNGVGCSRFNGKKSGLDVREFIGCMCQLQFIFWWMSESVAESSKVQKKYRQHSKKSGLLNGYLIELDELNDPNGVYYVECKKKDSPLGIVKRKIDVSDDLWNGLFSQQPTFVTSATLAVGGDCKFIRKQMGLKESREIIVGSPFDFKNQAMMILSRHAPDPTKRDEYPDEVAKVIEHIISKSKGRALCLFTSYRVLNTVKNWLTPERAGGYNILCQGEMPRMKLVKKFKDDVHSVLLGVESFWAGVDVPGESLSCLIIDKIPFKGPGDPVWEAMCEREGDRWFFNLSVPTAAIQFKQGVGRLIRSKTDRGVVVVLDRRMITKRYGGTFIDSLPEMRPQTTLKGSVISRFIDG
jgi:ATP-dependent DNA helicase DinG